MVDFICMGFLSCKEWKRDLRNENSSCPQRDSNSRPLESEAIALTAWPFTMYSGHTVDVLKLNLIFPLLFKSSSEHMAECFVVYSVLYSYSICIILRFDQTYKIILVHRLNKSSLCVPRYGYMSVTETELRYLAYLRSILQHFCRKLYTNAAFLQSFNYKNFFYTYLLSSCQIKYKMMLFIVFFFLHSNWRKTFMQFPLC